MRNLCSTANGQIPKNLRACLRYLREKDSANCVTLLVEQDHVEALAAVIERGFRSGDAPREILFEDGAMDRTALTCAFITGAFVASAILSVAFAVLT